MALLDTNSCECLKSELDLTSVPPTQTAIEETRYEKYYPLTSLSGSGPIEFLITPGEEDYLDLQNSFLYLKCRILDKDGGVLKAVDSDDKVDDNGVVYPINYFAATMFKQVEVFVGNTRISAPDTMYAHRAYLETTLSYADAKTEQLHCALYYKDSGDFDEHGDSVLKKRTAKNPGAFQRFERTGDSIIFEMFTRIHSEIFCQPKLLLNKLELKVKFHRHAPEFSLMAKKEDAIYKIAILEATMNICHKRISPSVRDAHETALLKAHFKYPVRKVDMKFFTRASGRSDITEPNLVNGELPRRVIIGVVSNGAFNGHLHQSPFGFKHYDARNIILRKNGKPLPFDNIEVDFENLHICNGYLSLLHATHRLFQDQNIGISREEYMNGYTLYGWDLSQDNSENNASLINEGNLSLEIKLRKATSDTVVIVVYLERDGVIEIDSDRNIHYE